MTLRRAYLVMALLLLVQFLLGMVTNLFVTIPAHHPGASPTNYFAGSADSIGWAIPAGGAWLAAHAALGLALAAGSLAVVAVALRRGGRADVAASAVAAAAVIGAGFNGASFLDFNHDVSSMIMAGLFAVALAGYLIALHLAVGAAVESGLGRPAAS